MVGLYFDSSKRAVEDPAVEVGYNKTRNNFDSETTEQLPEIIQGKRASEAESKFAVGIKSLKWKFRFRDKPGGIAEVDFLILRGARTFGINLDIHWTHKTPAQKTRDRLNEERLNDFFKTLGWQKLVRIDDQAWIINNMDELTALTAWLKGKFL